MSLTHKAGTRAGDHERSTKVGQLLHRALAEQQQQIDAGRHGLSRTRLDAVIPPCLTSETRGPVAVALERYQPVMAGRDAAIAWELNRLIEGRLNVHLARSWHAGRRARPCRCDRPDIVPQLDLLLGWSLRRIEPAIPSLHRCSASRPRSGAALTAGQLTPCMPSRDCAVKRRWSRPCAGHAPKWNWPCRPLMTVAVPWDILQPSSKWPR
jgi:hypothetical protein